MSNGHSNRWVTTAEAAVTLCKTVDEIEVIDEMMRLASNHKKEMEEITGLIKAVKRKRNVGLSAWRQSVNRRPTPSSDICHCVTVWVSHSLSHTVRQPGQESTINSQTLAHDHMIADHRPAATCKSTRAQLRASATASHEWSMIPVNWLQASAGYNISFRHASRCNVVLISNNEWTKCSWNPSPQSSTACCQSMYPVLIHLLHSGTNRKGAFERSEWRWKGTLIIPNFISVTGASTGCLGFREGGGQHKTCWFLGRGLG